MHALHGTRGVALCHTAVISTFVPNVGQVTIKTATVLALLPTDQWSRRVQGHQGRELLSVQQAHWHSHATSGPNTVLSSHIYLFTSS